MQRADKNTSAKPRWQNADGLRKSHDDCDMVMTRGDCLPMDMNSQ